MRRAWLALTFAMVFPTVTAWTYFIALSAPDDLGSLSPAEGSRGNTSSAVLFAYSAGKVVQFAFPLVYLWCLDPGSLRRPRLSLQGMTIGLGFGLLVAGAILLLYFGMLREHLSHIGTMTRVRAKVEQLGATTPARFFLFTVFLAGIHSLLEEYYWRWFVFGRLRLLVAMTPAVVLSSLGFMAHHVIVLAVYLPGQFLSLTVPLSLGIAVGGAFWAWLYERTGTLLAPWLSHLVIDLAIMALGYEMIFVLGR